MRTEEAAKIFKAWAQENHLIGHEFPVHIGAEGGERDALYDQLQITAASESILRTKHLLAVAFNEGARKITVLTSRKVSLRDQKILPKTIDDSIAIQYIHAGSAQAGAPSNGMVHSPYCVTHSGKYACGGSIHPARFLGSGTLGCLVRDEGGVLHGLTNNHVSGLCNYALDGEKIIAPGHIDISANGLDPFTIGYHARALPLVSGVPDNVDISLNQDAALIRIANSDLVSSLQGQVCDTPALASPLQAGLSVEKIGRTTGHTYGQVIGQVVGAFQVTYQVPSVGAQVAFFDAVFIVKGTGSPFSQPGDSGSLVISDQGGERRAVGLVFAGDAQGLSYILPLEPILTSLNVELVAGYNV